MPLRSSTATPFGTGLKPLISVSQLAHHPGGYAAKWMLYVASSSAWSRRMRCSTRSSTSCSSSASEPWASSRRTAVAARARASRCGAERGK